MPKCSPFILTSEKFITQFHHLKYSQHQILRYKKPLTDKLNKQFSIKEYRFKYHYDTANEVLLDYERFVVKFQNK